MQITQPTESIRYRQDMSPPKSPNFSSRKAIIKKLGDINMLAIREFPVYSSTRIARYKMPLSKKYNVYKYIENLIEEIRGFSKHGSTEKETVFKSLNAVKQFNVGNCGELAEASLVACRINGIKDAKNYSVFLYNPQTKKFTSMDHSVVGINMGKPSNIEAPYPVYSHNRDAIIMDPWAGFVDFECNASAKYKHDSPSGVKPLECEKVCYVENGYANNLGKTDILYLKHEYPELSKNKKFTIMEKIRWALLDKSSYDYEKMDDYIKESYRKNAHFKNALTQDELTDFLTKRARKRKKLEEVSAEIQKKSPLNKLYNKIYNLVFPN